MICQHINGSFQKVFIKEYLGHKPYVRVLRVCVSFDMTKWASWIDYEWPYGDKGGIKKVKGQTRTSSSRCSPWIWCTWSARGLGTVNSTRAACCVAGCLTAAAEDIETRTEDAVQKFGDKHNQLWFFKNSCRPNFGLSRLAFLPFQMLFSCISLCRICYMMMGVLYFLYNTCLPINLLHFGGQQWKF